MTFFKPLEFYLAVFLTLKNSLFIRASLSKRIAGLEKVEFFDTQSGLFGKRMKFMEMYTRMI